jgi:hypothetical protein
VNLQDDAALTALEARHLARLRDRVRHEAREDGTVRRFAWGHLVRDFEWGRKQIARALARLDLAVAEWIR